MPRHFLLVRGVAQLAEHRFPKPGVAGSIPAAPAGIQSLDHDSLEVTIFCRA